MARKLKWNHANLKKKENKMRIKKLVLTLFLLLVPIWVWAGPRITTAPPPDSTFLHSDTVSWDQSVEQLAGTKTLAITDMVVQKLDPNGATRIVLLPTEATSTDLLFVIMNTANGAAENLQVKEDSNTTIIDEIGPAQMAMVHCDGTVWKLLTDAGFYYDGVGKVVSFGSVTPATSAELDVTDINTGNGELHLRTFSTDQDRYSRLRLRKSNANTETLTATDDGDYLGIIQFEGANTTPGFAAGARIWARQTAAAGGQIPAYLSLAVSNDWANFNRQLFLMDEGLVSINARDYVIEDPEATLHVYGGTWTPLTGTVTATNGSNTLEGVTTTAFDTELVVGDVIRVESNISAANPHEVFTITNITDSDTLTLDSNYSGGTDTLLRIYEDHANLFKLSDGDSKDRLIVTKAGTLHLGVDNVIGNLVIHDIGTITLYDDGDDTSVVLGPVGDGTTVLAITGSVNLTGNVAGATYGSDGSISDAELLTLDNGAITEIPVGGGAGSAFIWTTATGTGAPVRAGSPTFTTQITTPLIYGGAAANDDITIGGTSHATKTTSYVILQPTGGNVGIGTTGPGSKLEVLEGTSAVGISLGTGIASGATSVPVRIGSTGLTYYDLQYYAHSTAASSRLDWEVNESPKLTLKGNGNVGIGTILPDTRFHVELDNAVTNAAVAVGRLSLTSTGTPAAGLGPQLQFEVETAAGAPGNMEVIAAIDGIATDVTSTSEEGALVFKTMTAGAAVAEGFRIQNQTVVYANETVTCVTNAGTADPLKTVSMIVTDGGADTNEDTVSLANGILTGQLKIFIYKTETDAGDTANVTPATGAGFTDILFSVPGQGCTMMWDGAGWSIVSNNGGVIT